MEIEIQPSTPSVRPQPAPFPTALCAGAILLTSSGASLAALDVAWGASTLGVQPLRLSFLYANIALAWTWLCLWPIFAARAKRNLLWDFLAVALGATPALALTAVISSVSAHQFLSALALQLALALFAAGILASRANIGDAPAAALLVALGLLAPLAAYVWKECFPAASPAWLAAIPAVALSRADRGTADSAAAWTASAYALIGIILLTLTRATTAPAPHPPRPSPVSESLENQS